MGKDGDPGGQTIMSKDPKVQTAKVRLLDGTHKDFELHRGSDGDVLFTLVSADLSIEEREYFSLCFYDTEGTRHWLYNEKKIIKQLKGLPWEFSFEVKFYPTVPSMLNDDHARYNLFLQLRNDIFVGKLPATVATHAVLGSFVAQAEFGDSTSSAEYEQYLRTTRIAPNMSDKLTEKIAELHREHKGQTPAEAENNYLDTCKQLSMYGVFLYNAKDNKNTSVGIGVCAHGINIYKEQIRVNRFAWQNIIKISYRKNQFAIKVKAGEVDKKEATVTYKLSDYMHAKKVWKCAVEHHTFFRLIQPEEKPKSSLFRWGSARFRYHGRTQFQTKMASQMFDRPSSVTVQRTNSARLTQSLDNGFSVTKDQNRNDAVSPLHYADNDLGSREQMISPAISYDLTGQNEKRKIDEKNKLKKEKKAKKAKGVKESDSSDSSISSDDEKKQIEVIAVKESGQPHTTVSSWQGTSQLPDEITTQYDEHGNKITRTVRTSQVKHTVQKQTFQNYVVSSEDKPGVALVEHSREQMTPLGSSAISGAPIVETHSRTVAYETSPVEDLHPEAAGEFVSSNTVTSGNRTVETITYKTEKDGIIETHVEHRVTIHSEVPIDHDAELSQAIMEATQMNPDMTVEKIEVRQESTA